MECRRNEKDDEIFDRSVVLPYLLSYNYSNGFEILSTLTFAGAKRPLVILRSLAITIPSLANIPTHVPALLIASMAYSTYENFNYAFPID